MLFCYLGTIQAQFDACEYFCSCEGNIATCVNTVHFPEFITRAWIYELIFIDSGISGLTPVSKYNFPNLRALTLRNCPFILCSQLKRLETEWPELIVSSDISCDITTTSSLTTTTTATTTATTIASSTSAITTITSPNTPTTTSTQTTSDSTTTVPAHGKEHDDSQTAIIASISVIGSIVFLLVVVLVGVRIYKKLQRDRVQPIVRPIVNPCFDMVDSIYGSTTYDTTV